MNSVTSKYKEHDSFLLLQWPIVLSRNSLRGNRGCDTVEQNRHSRNMATATTLQATPLTGTPQPC